ncbi:MAG: OmpA family protein, partial [Deltaproteobacteria bacterium]|nr:OmpA family protein [Deltaproteobacteria bacterium]
FRNVDISAASFLYGAGAAVRLSPATDLSLEVTGRTPTARMFKERAESPAELLVGGHYKVAKGLAVTAGGGVGLVHGAGAPMARAFAGVSYLRENEEFAAKQEALEKQKYAALKGVSPVKWNIVELRSVCPANAASFDPDVHDPGCPKFYELREVASLLLECPSRPEAFDPSRHDVGCQKIYALRETLSPEDYATVYVLGTADLAAKCPADPALFDAKIHPATCPKYFELRDVVALTARCPARAEDFRPAKHPADCAKVFEFRDTAAPLDRKVVGLMARADFDDDGVLDLDDRCPRLAGVASARGCPEKAVVVLDGVVQPKVPVQFAFNSALLTADARLALDEIAAWLVEHPEVRRVRIEGYADSIGSPRVNRWISRARASAVKNYLWSQGVEPKRLKSMGVGEANPIAPNTTPEGRALNRRAIFLVIER